MLDREAILLALHERFEGLSAPAFRVIAGEPLALLVDGSPYLAYWYAGRQAPDEGDMTLANRMNQYVFKIRAFWHRTPELSALPRLEQEIWDADTEIRAAIWGGFSLGGLVTALRLSDPTVDYGFFPQMTDDRGRAPMYRTLEYDLYLDELEGETIAP